MQYSWKGYKELSAFYWYSDIVPLIFCGNGYACSVQYLLYPARLDLDYEVDQFFYKSFILVSTELGTVLTSSL